MPNQLRKEDLRKAVRAYLADRIGTALSTSSIQRGLVKEWKCSEEDISAALYYLISTQPNQVDEQPDTDGATLYYRINAAGVKAHERSLS